MAEHKVSETLWQLLKLAKTCGQPSRYTIKATIDIFEYTQYKYLKKYKYIQSCACFFEIFKTWEPFLNSLKMCDLNASLPLVHWS